MTVPPQDLAATTRALERGNWTILTPAALRRLAGPSEETAWLAGIQLGLAASMRCQAMGAVTRADELLNTAAKALPRAFQRSVRGRWIAVLPARPPDDVRVPLLIWRTARVIFREQRGLDEHRARLQPGRSTRQEVLVVAYVEFLRWVACDYFLTADGVDARGICFEVQSGPLRQRATNLCRLADPTVPTLGQGVWRGTGGKVRLQAEALVLLAADDVVPQEGPGALPADIPVRCGRTEAHRRACQRRDDLR